MSDPIELPPETLVAGGATVPRFPDALQVPAHPSNYETADRAPTEIAHIVIHETDGHGVAKDTAEMWQTLKHGSSAHFVVGQDAQVVQAVQIKDVAWHAHAANKTSIGIEHCCRKKGELGADDPGLPASQLQLAASAHLTAWLCILCGLEPTRDVIRGHAEIDPETTHRDCPTACIDLDAYVVAVRAAYAALRLSLKT